MDRHLQPVGDALSRHHRLSAAQRLRPHARRRVRAAGQDGAAGLRPRPAGRPRCRTGRARQRPAAEHRRLAADPGPDRGAGRRRDRGDHAIAADRATRRLATAAAVPAPPRRRRRRSAASACGSAARLRPSCCWPAATMPWSTTSVAPQMAAQDAQLAAEAQRLKDQEELARLRAENERRLKAEQEAAQRKQIEEETRRKIEAEMADKKRQRGRSPPEGRCRGRREEAPGRRGAAEGGGRRRCAAPGGRGGEEGRRSGRKRPAIDGARPPAHPGRADGTRLRHRQHQRYVRQPHARDDRPLAEVEERAGDGLPDGGTEPGPPARCRAGSRALRRRAEEARGRAQEG